MDREDAAVWRKLCDPVASRVVGRDGRPALPPEACAQLGPMAAMMRQFGGLMFGAQVGQALGWLAAEVVGSSDIGLPLGPAGTAALIPANIAAFGEGLEPPADEVRLYLALREAAHQRLFEHVPWLRRRLLGAVETATPAASGSTGRRSSEAMGEVDPTEPGEHAERCCPEGCSAGGDPRAARRRLRRLETLLALVEGWVRHVVGSGRRRAAARRARAAARRSAAAGRPVARPSRPSRRWSGWNCVRGGCARRRRCGRQSPRSMASSGRDAIWGHPDLLPSADDLDDPLGFADTVGADPLAELGTAPTDPPSPPAADVSRDSGEDQPERGTPPA